MLESRCQSSRHIIFDNHTSSQLDPAFISTYIAKEQATGHYLEGFAPETLEKLIGPFQTSPLGLVPKPNSSTLWMVQDMSFLRDPVDVPSINAGVKSNDFPTTWGAFEATTNLILSLPPGCEAAV